MTEALTYAQLGERLRVSAQAARARHGGSIRHGKERMTARR
jgi:hypothetical protein